MLLSPYILIWGDFFMQNNVKNFAEVEQLNPHEGYYFNGSKTYQRGWKMHLFLNSGNDEFPILNDPRIKKLSNYLITRNFEHKFQNGCDDLNSFCIYIGSRDEAMALGKDLEKNFGKDFKTLSPMGNLHSGSDFNLSDNIGIRFDGADDKKNDTPFTRYGICGIPMMNYCDDFTPNELLSQRKTNESDSHILPFGEERSLLKTLAAHVALAKECGEYYLGKDYQQNPWDREIFKPLLDVYTLKEIDDFVGKEIQRSDPGKYIFPNVKAAAGQGIDISVYDIMGIAKGSPQAQRQEYNVLNNKIDVQAKRDKRFLERIKHLGLDAATQKELLQLHKDGTHSMSQIISYALKLRVRNPQKFANGGAPAAAAEAIEYYKSGSYQSRGKKEMDAKLAELAADEQPTPQPAPQPLTISGMEENTTSESAHTEENGTSTTVENNADALFKEQYRIVCRNIAAKNQGAKFNENPQSKNFYGEVLKTNGEKFIMEADDQYNVKLGATDASGKPKNPEYKDILELVKLAKSQDRSVNFGESLTDETRGRIWLACLNLGVETINTPKLEDLKTLSPETGKYLKAALTMPKTKQKSASRA